MKLFLTETEAKDESSESLSKDNSFKMALDCILNKEGQCDTLIAQIDAMETLQLTLSQEFQKTNSLLGTLSQVANINFQQDKESHNEQISIGDVSPQISENFSFEVHKVVLDRLKTEKTKIKPDMKDEDILMSISPLPSLPFTTFCKEEKQRRKVRKHLYDEVNSCHKSVSSNSSCSRSIVNDVYDEEEIDVEFKPNKRKMVRQFAYAKVPLLEDIQELQSQENSSSISKN